MTAIVPIKTEEDFARNCGLSDIPEDRQVTLSWKDLSFTVPDKKLKGAKINLIDKVSGVVCPGELLAIMGPSGSGKTTLLDSLGGGGGGAVSGSVLLNGSRLSKKHRTIMSFVAQEDTLMGVFTVKETLNYAAAFTLPRGTYTAEQRRERVQTVIDAVGLRSAENTIVGNIFRKGLSGGQKRRLSLAVELIKEPSVILLDEVTSGLDSTSAYLIMKYLAEFKNRGRTVATTIHQPSAGIWKLFDKVLFLVSGKCIYFGSVEGAESYFTSLGKPLPPKVTPPDHYIDVINTDFGKQAISLPALEEAWKSSDERKALHNEVTDSSLSNLKENSAELAAPQYGSFLTQFATLTHRGLQNQARNPGIVAVRLVMYAGLCFLLALFFLDLGDRKEHSDVQARINVLWYTASFLIFMSVAVLLFFVEIKATYFREFRNGFYKETAYVLAHATSSIPGTLVITVVSSLLLIYPTKLNNIVGFMIALFSGLTASEALMLLLSIVTPHEIIGIALGAGIFGFFMLAQGVLITEDNTPSGLIWANRIALHRYVFNAMAVNEFGDASSFNSPIFPTGKSVLDYFSIDEDEFGLDVGVSFCYTFIFYFFSWAALRMLRPKRTA